MGSQPGGSYPGGSCPVGICPRTEVYIICIEIVIVIVYPFTYQMRVWARPDAIDSVDYAVGVGVDALDYYDYYFMTKFPLPKMGKHEFYSL